MPNSPQARFDALGLVLPPLGPPKGLYRPCLVDGRTVLTSGHLPLRADGSLVTGCLGRDLDADAGKDAARLAGLAILATLRAEFGSLDRIARVVRIFGMVRASEDFQQQPHVVNGCSELFAEVWGDESGVGVRSAVGVASLPAAVAVEIEAAFELA